MKGARGSNDARADNDNVYRLVQKNTPLALTQRTAVNRSICARVHLVVSPALASSWIVVCSHRSHLKVPCLEARLGLQLALAKPQREIVMF